VLAVLATNGWAIALSPLFSARPTGAEARKTRNKTCSSGCAAHIVGYFDTIDAMHAVYNRHKGHTALSVDESGWRLVK